MILTHWQCYIPNITALCLAVSETFGRLPIYRIITSPAKYTRDCMDVRWCRSFCLNMLCGNLIFIASSSNTGENAAMKELKKTYLVYSRNTFVAFEVLTDWLRVICCV